jgi:hypothetical protein
MAKGVPFHPLATIAGGEKGSGRMLPVLSEDGQPVLQGGDTDPTWYAITSVGWFHANAARPNSYADIQGWAYLTGARAVVVAANFQKGGRVRAIGIPSLTELALIGVSNQVSKARAKKATAGTYMAGHMRWPWVRSVVWAPASTERKQRGEVRLIGSHRTAFGDQEAVGITLRLAKASDVVPFVTAVVDRVLADRFHHEQTTDDERNLLKSIPRPSTVAVPGPGKLPNVTLAGSYVATSGSAYVGLVSALSAEVPA